MPEEYISREAARRMVNQLPRYTWSSPVSTDYCVAVSKDAVLFGLDRIPAADVAEVVHGRWISTKDRLPDKGDNYGCANHVEQRLGFCW